jgi:hypothetical protein
VRATLILGRVATRASAKIVTRHRADHARWPEEDRAVETLLAVGVGFLAIVVIVVQYGLLTKLADRTKKRRDTWSD